MTEFIKTDGNAMAILEFVEAAIDYAFEKREVDEDGYRNSVSCSTKERFGKAIKNLEDKLG
jgi:hypothetical protein